MTWRNWVVVLCVAVGGFIGTALGNLATMPPKARDISRGGIEPCEVTRELTPYETQLLIQRLVEDLNAREAL